MITSNKRAPKVAPIPTFEWRSAQALLVRSMPKDFIWAPSPRWRAVHEGLVHLRARADVQRRRMAIVVPCKQVLWLNPRMTL